MRALNTRGPVGARSMSIEGAWGAEDVAEVPSFDEIFHRHADAVCRRVGRLLGPTSSTADIDDVCQQVFLAVHRGLPKFKGESQLSTWIYGITTRVVLRYLRGWRRYRLLIQRFEGQLPLQSPAGLEESAAQRQALERVWSVLIRLEPERRVVFLLHEWEGLTALEIADQLGLTEEAVRSRLRRARAELETRLQKRGERL